MSACRFCGTPLSNVFIDLGESPVSNSFLTKEELALNEEKYPLKIFVCDRCRLVQVEEFKKARDIFSDDYAYFSSFSTTWLAHAKEYCNAMISRFNFDASKHVVEIASNDGYLLQYFAEKEIPVLGIEPASNTAAAAEKKGIRTITEYFTSELAKKLTAQNIHADLLIGNNVLAHVPDVNDFVEALKILLAPEGIITMEFPHLYRLVQQCQFDTIYHEHFSYFSFTTVKKIFEAHELILFDVEEISTHGGSLRIFGKQKFNERLLISHRVNDLTLKEDHAGMNSMSYYAGFQPRCEKIKNDLLQFLRGQKQQGKKVAAYGAAAKGNTLLNYCSIANDLISFVADRSAFKQGKFLPGSHIPVLDEEALSSFKPDYILILPWNIKEEIMEQLSYAKAWGTKFVIAIPELKIY